MEAQPHLNIEGYLSRFTIRARLLSAYGLLLALMVLLAVMGWRTASYCRDAFETLQARNVQGAVQLAKVESAMWKLRYALPQFLVLGPKDREQYVAEGPQLYKEINDALAIYESVERTPAEKKLLASFHEVFEKYSAARPKWFQLQMEGKTEEAATWRAATTFPFGAASVKTLSELIE